MIRIKVFIIGLLSLNWLSSFSQNTLPTQYPGGIPINFVRIWEPVKPYTSEADVISTSRLVKEVRQTTQYFDGLGRPLQTVIKSGSMQTGQSPTDIVSPVVYDAFGREQYKYLPYASTDNSGNFKINPFRDQADFYNNQLSGQPGETNIGTNNLNWAYSKTNFEASPLNRVGETYAPGVSWVGSEGATNPSDRHPVKMKYWINTLNDAVRIWNVTDVSNNFGTYASAAIYPAGELYKNVTIDERGKQVIEFKDKEGQVILKKVQLTATEDNGAGTGYDGWLCTYYIYDDFNRLRCVIQPEGVKFLAIPANNWTFTTTILAEQCFRYEYDGRSRMIMKQVPGAQPVYMVYDKRDRLILTQDGNLRSQNKWVFTKYDALNRPVYTGFHVDNTHTTLAAKINDVNNSNAGLFETRNNQLDWTCYTKTQSYPTNIQLSDILTVTYYDDYEWTGWRGGGLTLKNNSFDSYFAAPSDTQFPYPQPLTQSSAVKGLVTGTSVNPIGHGYSLCTILYYDSKGRVIQTRSDNSAKNSIGTDIATTQYSWSGQPLQTVLHHVKAGTNSQTTTIVTLLTYDDLGRLVKTEKKTGHSQLNSGALPSTYTVTSQLEYDKLGQLKNKKLAPYYNSNAGLETLTYDYNIRGWMLGVNKAYLSGTVSNNWIGMELAYDNTLSTINGNTVWYYAGQFNGNIAGTSWKTQGDNKPRRYNFEYDNVNRLGRAIYAQENGTAWNADEMNFSVMGYEADNGYQIKYDDNGNILRMLHSGIKINTPQMYLDVMRYTYLPNSNKLKSVTDFSNDVTTTQGDFKTLSTHSQAASKSVLNYNSAQSSFDAITDYNYDANGNLISDQNKGISSITYNHLNLPQTITVTGKGTITYTYDATGNKLWKETVENNVTVPYNGTNYNSNITTTTTYIAGLVYESKSYSNSSLSTLNYTDKLKFTGHEEGRTRALYANNASPTTITGFANDYFVKDHLGNIRMVLTDEQQVNYYPATTLEGTFSTSNPQANSMVNHEKTFYNINNSYIVNKPWTNTALDYANHNNIPPASPNPNYPSGVSPTQTATSTKTYKLNASVNKTGLEFIMKVMAGDKVDILGKSYHANTTTVSNGNSTALTLLSMLTNLLGAPANPISGKGITATELNTSAAGIPSTFFRGNNGEGGTSVPKAYINYVFLDEQFKYAGGGFSRVGSNGTVKDHFTADAATLQNINVPKNGYLLVYVSNESNFDVFFDNLQVVHKPGPLVEETHYYPFGLTMSGISSKAANTLQNKEKTFQGQQIDDDLGLNWIQFKWRNHDPQIGRFIEIDPLSEKYEYNSTYAFSENKVTGHVELEGLEAVPIPYNRPKPYQNQTMGDMQIKKPPLLLNANVTKNPTPAAITFTVSKGKQFGVKVAGAGAELNFGSKEVFKVSNVNTNNQADTESTKKGKSFSAGVVSFSKEVSSKQVVTGTDFMGRPVEGTQSEVYQNISIGIKKTPLSAGVERTWGVEQAYPSYDENVTSDTGPQFFVGGSVSPGAGGSNKKGTEFSISAYYKLEVNINVRQVLINIFESLNKGGY
jgi:RHS repeat-associated protein